MPVTHFSSHSNSQHYFHFTQPMKITSTSSSTSPHPTAGHLPGAAQNHPLSPAMLGGVATPEPTYSLNSEHKKLQSQAYCPQDQETEQMFEKPLTPSDVGKLNRLVIPKQHAEKYFPLAAGGVESADKGLLLSFEDESGKSWRFRYSYWNSSQSYVLTKGWSRFVKEKQLDAGDVVSFQSLRVDRQRFFIRWRRGPSTLPAPVTFSSGSPSATWTQVYFSDVPYPTQHLLHNPPLHHSHHCIHAGVGVEPVVENEERGSWKRLRLFGVNLECRQLDESGEAGSSPLVPSLSSQGQTHLFYPPHGSSHA